MRSVAKGRHSARKASMGRVRAARMAGNKPAIVPATTMSNVASTHTSIPTVGLRKVVILAKPRSVTSWPNVASMYWVVAMPSNMPT